MLHWHSYLLKPDFFWLHVTFATLIALFYYSISILLIYLLHQRRHSLVEPKAGIWIMLATFTIANGTTYLTDIWKIWYPNYWLANGIETVAAIISWCTAFLLVKFVAKDIAQRPPDKDLQSQVVSREDKESKKDNLPGKDEALDHSLETTTPILAEKMSIEEIKVLQQEQLEKDLPKNNEIYRVLVEETARLASVPLLAPNPIVETDLEGQILYLNPEAIQLFPDLQDTGVKHPFLTELLSLVEILKQEGSLMREVKVGQAYYEQVLHFVEGMGCLRIYGFDITDRRKAQEQLIYNAFYDQLTELPNRALFMDRLYQAFRRAQKYVPEDLASYPYRIAVLYLNLDRFKLVNESLGEKVGDLLLRGVAYRLQTCLRPTDTLARLGGDEFAVLLEGIESISEATNIADAIHQALSSPFYLENSEVFISASIGIALNTTNEP
ncbi:MAG: diguanylate cyclase, partial [Symploca sp. SIO1B1]|nr:diguanylate cyclase [Symploca sp. SIO1B1]